jgi:hypothetical protein
MAVSKEKVMAMAWDRTNKSHAQTQISNCVSQTQNQFCDCSRTILPDLAQTLDIMLVTFAILELQSLFKEPNGPNR